MKQNIGSYFLRSRKFQIEKFQKICTISVAQYKKYLSRQEKRQRKTIITVHRDRSDLIYDNYMVLEGA